MITPARPVSGSQPAPERGRGGRKENKMKATVLDVDADRLNDKKAALADELGLEVTDIQVAGTENGGDWFLEADGDEWLVISPEEAKKCFSRGFVIIKINGGW